MNAAQYLLTLALRFYRAVVSPALVALFAPMGFGCRYTPTCSEYAIEAVRLHGAWRGTCLTGGRLCRCQPWGGSGPDPVPPKISASPKTFSSTLTSCRNGS